MLEDEFAPPAHDAIPGGVEDDDIGEIRVPIILPLAAFVAIVSALFTASAGAQGLIVIHYPSWSWMRFVPYIFLMSGVLGLVVGGQVYTGRLWGTIAAVIVIGFNAVCGGLWFLIDLFSGMFVPLPAIAALLAILATILVAFAIPASARLSAQRARLYS